MRAGLHNPVISRVRMSGTFLGKSWFCTSRAISSSDCSRSFSLATTISRSRFAVMVLKETPSSASWSLPRTGMRCEKLPSITRWVPWYSSSTAEVMVRVSETPITSETSSTSRKRPRDGKEGPPDELAPLHVFPDHVVAEDLRQHGGSTGFHVEEQHPVFHLAGPFPNLDGDRIKGRYSDIRRVERGRRVVGVRSGLPAAQIQLRSGRALAIHFRLREQRDVAQIRHQRRRETRGREAPPSPLPHRRRWRAPSRTRSHFAKGGRGCPATPPAAR